MDGGGRCVKYQDVQGQGRTVVDMEAVIARKKHVYVIQVSILHRSVLVPLGGVLAC